MGKDSNKHLNDRERPHARPFLTFWRLRFSSKENLASAVSSVSKRRPNGFNKLSLAVGDL